MALIEPNKGVVEGTIALRGGQANPLFPTRPPTGEGMRVILRRIPKFTARGLLQEPFIFQVPPTAFGRGFAHAHSEYDTLRAGQRSRSGGRALRTVAFSSMFVADKYTWTLLDPHNHEPDWFPNPLRMLDVLERIVHAGTPVWVEAFEPGARRYDVDMAATIRSVEIRSDEPHDRTFDMSIVEYRDARLRRHRRGSGTSLPVTLLVRKLPDKRRTLYKLSAHYYKSSRHWRVIQASNARFKNTPPSKDLKETKAFEKNKDVKILVPKLPKPDPPPGASKVLAEFEDGTIVVPDPFADDDTYDDEANE